MSHWMEYLPQLLPQAPKQGVLLLGEGPQDVLGALAPRLQGAPLYVMAQDRPLLLQLRSQYADLSPRMLESDYYRSTFRRMQCDVIIAHTLRMQGEAAVQALYGRLYALLEEGGTYLQTTAAWDGKSEAWLREAGFARVESLPFGAGYRLLHCTK